MSNLRKIIKLYGINIIDNILVYFFLYISTIQLNTTYIINIVIYLYNHIMALNPQYIYLLQEREFIKTKEDIYKIGKTKQSNDKRFKQYPKDSILLYQIICDNCDFIEKNLIKEFKNKFTHSKTIGNEYFKGNYKNMIDTIHTYITYKCDPNKITIDNFIEYYLKYFYSNGITFNYFKIKSTFLYDEFKWWSEQNNIELISYDNFIKILEKNKLIRIKYNQYHNWPIGGRNVSCIVNKQIYFTLKNVKNILGIESIDSADSDFEDDNKSIDSDGDFIDYDSDDSDDSDNGKDIYNNYENDLNCECNNYYEHITFNNLKLIVDNYEQYKYYRGINNIIITNKETKEGFFQFNDDLYRKLYNTKSEDYNHRVNEDLDGLIEDFSCTSLCFSKTIKNDNKIIEEVIWRKMDKSSQDMYEYSLSDKPNVKKIIEDIIEKCYVKNPKFYNLEYCEYAIGYPESENNYILTTILNMKNMEYKNTNEIGKKYIINSFYSHGFNSGNGNIDIINKLLKYIVSDEKIIEYKKLCKSIFIEKSKIDIIFYDYFNSCYCSDALLTTYIKDISCFLNINYIDSDIYYKDKKEYLDGTKLKENYRFVIIYIKLDNKNKMQKMIKEFKKLEITNILIILRPENISQNVYKCSYEQFKKEINNSKELYNSMTHIPSCPSNKIYKSEDKTEYGNMLENTKRCCYMTDPDLLILALKSNFIHWIGQSI